MEKGKSAYNISHIYWYTHTSTYNALYVKLGRTARHADRHLADKTLNAIALTRCVCVYCLVI